LQGKTQRHIDVTFNETGKQQAIATANEVAKVKVDYIFSSPLSRAYETAEIINKQLRLDLPIKKDARLIEFGAGELEGRNDLTEEQKQVYFDNREKYGLETPDAVFGRVKSFFDEITTAGLENVLIVSHSGAIKMMLYYAKHKEFSADSTINDDFRHIPVGNGVLIKWDSDGYPRLL